LWKGIDFFPAQASHIVSKARQGDTVHVHYTGRLDDGTVFDSSQGREPLSFVLGKGDVIPGFEKAIEGLTVGEQTSAQIAPEDAYGPRSDTLILTVPHDLFPDGVTPAVGQRFEMSTEDGRRAPVVVTGVTEESVQIDANHPLAGEQLNFDLELVRID
jgi:peptidylprolyl isomerase